MHLTAKSRVLDAHSISVNREYRQFEAFSSLISPVALQITCTLVLRKTNISSKWRYFGLRLFINFEHNDNRLISLYDITVASELNGTLIVCSTAGSV